MVHKVTGGNGTDWSERPPWCWNSVAFSTTTCQGDTTEQGTRALGRLSTCWAALPKSYTYQDHSWTQPTLAESRYLNQQTRCRAGPRHWRCDPASRAQNYIACHRVKVSHSQRTQLLGKMSLLSQTSRGELYWQCTVRWKCHRSYVTHSDKRGAKSLGRSRDNWSKHHLGVVLSIYCFWFLFHITYSYCSQPILTYKLYDFKIHFKSQKPTTTKAVQILSLFQLHFLEMATLLPTILL